MPEGTGGEGALRHGFELSWVLKAERCAAWV
jgi:hypothetical protein